MDSLPYIQGCHLLLLPDVVRKIADVDISNIQSRLMMKSVCKAWNAWIPRYPPAPPSERLTKQLFRWESFVCWWCLRKRTLADILKTKQISEAIETFTCHSFSSYTKTWATYEQRYDDSLAGAHTPLYCQDCLYSTRNEGHGIPPILRELIDQKCDLSINLYENQRQSVHLNRNKKKIKIKKDRSSNGKQHGMSTCIPPYLRAIRDKDAKIFFKHSPITPASIHIDHDNRFGFEPVCLFSWGKCSSCNWHGDDLDRCPICRAVIHVGGCGGDPTCKQSSTWHEKHHHHHQHQHQQSISPSPCSCRSILKSKCIHCPASVYLDDMRFEERFWSRPTCEKCAKERMQSATN